MPLTARQQRFAEEYLIDTNATQAAIRAGYSKKTANEQGARLLTNVSVREYLDEKLAELQSARIADAQEVMEYLTSVMRREKCENAVVTLNEERSFYAPDENGTMRKSTVKQEVPQLVEYPTRVSDANKAAELLGKRHGLWSDAADINIPIQVVVSNDYDTDDPGPGEV